QSELGLSSEQVRRIEAVGESLRENEAIRDIFSRMREADENERAALMEEMQRLREQQRQESDAEIQKIVSPEQFTRLGQLRLHREGARVLGEEEVAREFNLTDSQKEQVKTLLEEWDSARREVGFRASEEERQKLQDEWNAKVLAVLTPDQ